MGTITGTEISQAVRVLSHDNDTTYRWNDAVHLVWLNDAIRALCAKRPEESVKEGAVNLASGTRQELPDEAVLLLRPICNMYYGIGAAVTFADRQSLDLQYPTWRLAAPNIEISHVLYNPEVDINHYEVYPPALAESALLLLYSVIPTPRTSLSETIPVSDKYVNALQAYMMFRYFSADAEDAANGQAATSYFNLFNAEVSG